LIAVPTAPPICGSLPGPKIINTTTSSPMIQ